MNKLLIQIPTTFFTERLQIRAPQPGDEIILHNAIFESITELKPWIKSLQHIPTKETVQTLLIQYQIHFLQRSALPYFIFSKETGAFIGFSIFHEIHWGIPKLELGYWIHSAYRNKGYMTEGINKLVQIAFEDLQAKRIEIRCEVENKQSRAIPEKLKFKLEGILEQNTFTADQKSVTDTCLYAMTRSYYDGILKKT